jgi:Potential Queuosine, Q, salvage protein family
VSGTPQRSSVFARIRAACAAVADRATRVAIDDRALDRLAAGLERDEVPLLPEERPPGDDEAVAAHVVAWNAVNFGSGWFPLLAKRPGLSGARTLAAALADHVAAAGPPTAGWLARADVATCATVFRQPHPGPVDDLLALYARSWNGLGRMLAGRHAGSALALVAGAGGSAAALVDVLAGLPLGGDVAAYGDLEVPFLKRAQITVSHLARAFGSRGPGWFEDARELTAFADNLVPHVLRTAGVLAYDDGLAARIARGELLAPGGPQEVEIRACGVEAVERLASRTGLAPAAIDAQLWQRGQDPAVKALPRHRCRTTAY